MRHFKSISALACLIIVASLGAVFAQVKPGTTPARAATAATGGTVTGAYATRPAAGTAGKIFVCTDCRVALWVDSGTAWTPIVGGTFANLAQPPAAATFTAANQGTSTLTDDHGALNFSGPNDGAATLRSYVKTNASATAYVTAVIAWNGMMQTCSAGVYGLMGITARESATAKTVNILVTPHCDASSVQGGTWTLEAQNWSSNTTVGTVTLKSVPLYNSIIILRLRRATTVVVAEFSQDAGNTWTTLQSYTVATVYTTAPDTYGLAGNGQGNTVNFHTLAMVLGG